MKMVYLAHPFLGKQENVSDAEKIELKLLRLYPNLTFYSPLHATGFFYFTLSYEDGMKHCYEALSRCDELWLCDGWQNSAGCNLEVEFARGRGMPIHSVSEMMEDGK